MPSITITIPSLPPRECSPNSRVHWRVRNRAAQEAKNVVAVLVMEQRKRTAPWGRARVSMSFGLPDHRVRDMDNLIAAAKPFLDGIKGLVILDDAIRNITLEYSAFESPKKPMTIITVTEA
jgi:Holliday junction resolvase RusA-like endonuclease